MGNSPVSQWILSLGIYPLLVMIVPTLTLFRKRGREVMIKQGASLAHAIIVFLVCASAMVVVSLELSDIFLLPAVLLIGFVAYLLRKRVFPYRLACPECGHRHNLLTAEFRNVYVMDDNLCNDCRRRLHPAAAPAVAVAEPEDNEPEWDGEPDEEDDD